MSRYTRKIQVALTEEQYQVIAALAARDHKAIGVVVREAVESTCLRQHRAQDKAEAMRSLLAAEPAAAPDDYHEWEEEYSRLKWAGDGCND
ncbi:MAG: hypothetical protein HYZ50_03795 [Deltaproteobacteria bacterium]|nr:hypothetical protein [Deltaproteobacteria bacterium]